MLVPIRLAVGSVAFLGGILASTQGPLAAAAAAPAARPTSASVGAGVGAKPIVLEKPASAGQSYTLPALYVVNTGNTRATLRVTVKRLSSGAERNVPTRWVVFGQNALDLAGNQSATVPLELDVPASAAPGTYMTNLVVGTFSAGSQGGGATFGAAAATRLTFSVVAGARAPLTLPSWLPAGLAVMALATILVLVVRSSGVRIEVRRR
jgi:hypothetical protein